MVVRTRKTVVKDITDDRSLAFQLNQIRQKSKNVEVRKYPLRVICWGLTGDDKVKVKMARVSSVGNPNWAMSELSQCNMLEPDVVANVQSLPYKVNKGEDMIELEFTAKDPSGYINATGVYYFEYEGSDEVFIDYFNDVVISKGDL